MLGRLWPRNDAESLAAIDAGYDLARVLTTDDLVAGDDCLFSATGVTHGDVLQGVRLWGATGATTESLVMRSRSGTVRRIHARHDRSKLRQLYPEYWQAGGQRPLHRKRPVRDSASSSRASERRKPCVTSTWIADCVAA